MIPNWPRPKPISWWAKVVLRFKKWFNIHPQSQQINTGNRSIVVVVNGQEFSFPASATDDRLRATIVALTRAIERLAEHEPAIAHAFKPAVKARACHTRVKGDDLNVEQTVLGPFIRKNFKKEKSNEKTILCNPPVVDSLPGPEFRMPDDAEDGPMARGAE